MTPLIDRFLALLEHPVKIGIAEHFPIDHCMWRSCFGSPLNAADAATGGDDDRNLRVQLVGLAQIKEILQRSARTA